jgi:hypothetical protein
MAKVMERWGQLEGPKAVAYAEKLFAESGNPDLLKDAMRGWGQTDPQASIAYTQAMEVGDGIRRDITRDLFRDWADRNPQGAASYAASNPMEVGRGLNMDRHDLGAECVPKFDDGGSGLGGCIHARSDETGAVFEEGCGAVFPAGFFGAGHGVRADEVGVGCEGGVTEEGDFVFHAADVGDERAGGQVRGDLAGEVDDLVDGCGDHD